MISVGRLAIDLNFFDAAFIISSSIVEMFKKSPKSYKIRMSGIDYLGEVGKYSANKEIDYLDKYSSKELYRLSKIVIIDNHIKSLRKITKYLSNINEIYRNKNNIEKVKNNVIILKNIAIYCANNGLEKEIVDIQEKILSITNDALKNNFNLEIDFSEYLVEIGEIAIQNEVQNEKIIKIIRDIPVRSSNINLKRINEKIELYQSFNSKNIVSNLMDSISSIALKTADQKNDSSTQKIVNYLFIIYNLDKEQKVLSFFDKFRDIALLSLKNDLYSSTDTTINIIQDILKSKSLKKRSFTVIRATSMLSDICTLAIDQVVIKDNYYEKYKLEEIYNGILVYLLEFGNKLLKLRSENIIFLDNELANICKKALKNGNSDIPAKILDFNESVGKESVKNGLTFGLNASSSTIAKICECAIEQGFNNILFQSVDFFSENVNSIIEMKAHLALQYMVSSLGKIGKNAAKNESINLLNISVQALEKVGKNLIEAINTDKKDSEEEINEFVNLIKCILCIESSVTTWSHKEAIALVENSKNQIVLLANTNTKLTNILNDIV